MTFCERLKLELKNPLPGAAAQLKMAPVSRQLFDSSVKYKNAAVALIIFPELQYEIFLIKRPEYTGHHSSQVSLPGGKYEKSDKDLLDTAIRETYEETGIQLSVDDLLGTLSPLQIPVSGFLVHPFVFRHSKNFRLNLEKSEVQYLIKVPLKDLLQRSIKKEKTMSIEKKVISVPYYDIQGETIWGATAMILSELTEVISNTIQFDNYLFL